MTQGPLLRRHACIVAYWQHGEWIFENYATGVTISAKPPAADILHFFDRWRSAETVVTRLADYDPRSLRAIIAALERHSFLARPGQKMIITWNAADDGSIAGIDLAPIGLNILLLEPLAGFGLLERRGDGPIPGLSDDRFRATALAGEFVGFEL